MSSPASDGGLGAEAWVPDRGLPIETRRRLNPNIYRTAAPRLIGELESEGWILDRRNKASVRMRRPKPHDQAFRDRVWAALARLQFGNMSRGDSIAIPTGPSDDQVKTANILAADDEVVLVVDCISMEALHPHSLRDEIADIQASREGVVRSMRRRFPGHKVKFIIATNQCIISKSTASKLDEADIVLMDEDTIDYYLELAEHLGKAARYQLLGSLFAGTRIPGLEPKVAAIQCNMGGHKYYSFVIEPDRLLKLGYILHRNKANSSLMPTYQRLIKKSRLRRISQFIESGGFFPNSLIISIDPGRRQLRFDPAGRGEGSPRLGILHLPQTYRAAYIIDGQHRLYGYADSSRAETDLIPVVAFVDLPRPEQVKIFMQINENQQAVPKNLRNTLNADLLWTSPDLREQSRALKLRMAQHLGDSKRSPLFGRIIVGEDHRSATRCITIDAVSRGLDRGAMMSSYTRTDIRQKGTLDRGSNDATFEFVTEFVGLCFFHLRSGLEGQWSLGSAEGGFVFINNGVESLLRIFSDIVDHVLADPKSDPQAVTPEDLFQLAVPYLDPLVAHLAGLDPHQAATYKSQYGSGAATKYWRWLQEAVRLAKPDFDPPDLEEYIASQARQYDSESLERVRAIELFLKKDIRARLEGELGPDWFRKGVPPKVKLKAGTMAAEKNASADSQEEEVEEWDCLFLLDYQSVLLRDHDFWVRLFEKQYTKPGEEQKKGGWRARVDWLQRLSTIRNDLSHGRSVGPDEHEFLIVLESWLVKGQLDNDL